MEDFVVNYGINISLGLVGICLALVLLFGVWQLIVQLTNSPGEAIKSILGFALLAVIIFVVYSTASSEATGVFTLPKYDGVTDFVHKYTTAGILVSGILITLAFGLWVVMELVNLVK